MVPTLYQHRITHQGAEMNTYYTLIPGHDIMLNMKRIR